MALARIVALVAAGCVVMHASARPNVLLVLADDLNDWVGCLTGHANARTPHIDRLASQGIVFREAYAASPKCNPSRTSLFLGLRPSTTGIYDNSHWWRPHLPDAVTLPEAFRQGGYFVAGGGKVFHHTAGFNPPDLWDDYFRLRFDDPWDRDGSAYPHVTPSAPPRGHPLAGITPFRHELDWGTLPVPDSEYGDAMTVEWAARFLSEPREEPFLLAVGLFHPHLPWYVPARYFDVLSPSEAVLPQVPELDLADVPDEGRRLAGLGAEVFRRIRESGRWAEAVSAYVASIAFADALVGRLVDALDASPHASRTVVVFASDHGFHLGEKGRWYKSTLWERATHVPLVMRGPGIEPGAICDRPVSLVDIYPTLLDIASLPARENLDGRSFRALLADPEAEPDRHALIAFLRGNNAVRAGKWLYIRYRDGGEELYDRESDPLELTNLARREELGGIKRELGKLLPSESSAEAPVKGDYDFDPLAYSWKSAR